MTSSFTDMHDIPINIARIGDRMPDIACSTAPEDLICYGFDASGIELCPAAVVWPRTTEDVVKVDAVMTFLGFKPDLGPVKSWGLELEKGRVKVSRLMETTVPGVYAAGDMVDYEGKLDLIATGFAEAAVAVNNALLFVDPKARKKPGHSTSMKIFTDR